MAKALQREGSQAESAAGFREAAALAKRQEDGVQCTRLSNEGLDAAHRGDTPAAARILRQAVDLRPDAPIAHYNLGLILADRGEIAEGIAQVVEAISLAPADARFYAALRQMYSRTGDWTRARAAFERAVHLQPDNRIVQAELAKLAKAHQSAPVGKTAEGEPLRIRREHILG